MENDNFKVSEEMEILIAKRLLGEISKDENVKLEVFLQDNPEIKKAYYEKEGVKRLLVNAADNLEELQLPVEKRNVLLNKIASRNSGKFILYTYVAAASVFFAFMIGIYFYADKKLQNSETSIVYQSKEITKEEKADNDMRDAKDSLKEDRGESQLDEDIAIGKDGAKAFGKKNREEVSKIHVGELQDMQEEVREIAEDKPKEKLVESKKLDKPANADSKNEKSIATKSKKSEEKIYATPPQASSVPIKEEAAKKKVDGIKSLAEEEEKNNEELSYEEKRSKNELKKSDGVIKALKEVDDGSQKDKKNSGGGSADRTVSKINEPTSPEGGLKGEVGNVAAAESQQFDYKAEFKFQESNYLVQFTSSVDLANAENAKKLTLRQFLEFPDGKEARDKVRANLKGGSPKLNIRFSQFLSRNIEEKQKDPKAPTKTAESKPDPVVALSAEVALLFTCFGEYEKRDALNLEAKKKFLSELKTVLLHLTHFKEDPDLKTWLANIEKELK